MKIMLDVNVMMDVAQERMPHYRCSAIVITQFSQARKRPIIDFEDAVIAVLAEHCRCEYIITRNRQHFKKSQIEALTPEQFISKYVHVISQ